MNHNFVICPRGFEPLLADALASAGSQGIAVAPAATANWNRPANA